MIDSRETDAIRDENAQRLLGAVLAGGRSSRMGRDKALLPHPEGGTFLEYVVNVLRSCCYDVIVSGQYALPDARALPDPAQGQGPAIGVTVAVEEARRLRLAGALIVAVDMPRVVSEDLRRLMDAWDRQPQRIITATFAEDFPEPLLAIYPVACLEALQGLAASPDRSLSRWLAGQSCEQVPLPSRAAANINTTEEWKRL